MLKDYKDITNRYLKHNKKRTVFTILGVILSVALITAVGLFIKSLQNTYVQNTINSTGSYHLYITGADKETYNKLKNNVKVDKIGIIQQEDICYINKSKSITITKISSSALSMLPEYYRAEKGRLPKRAHEIAVEEWTLNYMPQKIKIGDTLKLKDAAGKLETYKLTGIIPDSPENQYYGKATGIIYGNSFQGKKAYIYITINKSAGIGKTARSMIKKYKNAALNSDLLNYMGQGSNAINNQLYKIAFIIILIIVVATSAVIYNSFQISVMERIKQFGLIRTVGATPKQIRSIVFREAFIISVIGIPLGLLSGIAALLVVAKIFSLMSDSAFGTMKIVINYYTLLISALVGILAVYISAMLPARFAGKISPLLAISSRSSIVKERIGKRRGKIAKKFMNIEALMAFKNIKRNGKRFRVTVFSIVISITLFVFFYSFINMTEKFSNTKSESAKTDFSILSSYSKDDTNYIQDPELKKIEGSSFVKAVYKSYGSYASKILIDTDKKNEYAAKNQTGSYKFFTNERLSGKSMAGIEGLFDIYDEEKLDTIKNYVKSGSINEKTMEEDNGIILVKNTTFIVNKNYYHGNITKLKVGDSLYVDKKALYNGRMDGSIEEGISDKDFKKGSFRKENIVKLTIAGIVDESPYGLYHDKNDSLHIIIPKAVMEKMASEDKSKLKIESLDIRLKNKKYADAFNSFASKICDDNHLRLIDMIAQARTEYSSMLQLKVLMYGFIAVISLIGAVNIVNTITTNLILRRKEIASLNAMGMTYKNIRFMVLFEGVLYGIYGSFYGGIAGTGLSYLMYNFMSRLMGFKWDAPWTAIIIASLTSIFIGMVSVTAPLNKIKKDNVIEVIREEV